MGGESRARASSWLLAVVVFCAAVGLGLEARAQEAKASESDGLGAGKLRFHPGLLLEGGFDSNVFREDAQEAPTGAPIIAVRPRFGLTLANPTSVAAELETDLLYKQYISSEDVILEQSGFTINANGKLTFNPRGAVAFTIHDAFRRTNETPNQELFLSYDRIYNEVGGSLLIQPGGKVLTLELGGALELWRHDELDQLDRNAVRLKATGKWKFLPKTAVLIDVDQRFVLYDVQERTVFADGDIPSYAEPFQGALQNVDSSPLRITGGIAGLLLNRLSVVALLGYGNGFYDDGENFNSVLARAEIGYEIGPTSRLRLGYEHNFQDSTFANFFTVDRVYARYNQLFGGRLLVRLEGDFEYRAFSTTVGPTLDQVSVDGTPGASAFSTPDRVDPVFKLLAEGTLRFADFWRVGARYSLDANTTDFVFITGSVNPSGADPDDVNTNGTALASYQQHQILVFTGVEW